MSGKTIRNNRAEFEAAVAAEAKAWEELGMQTLGEWYDRIHDHGQAEQPDGSWKQLPSGKIGERCQTCGKMIEPI